MVVVVVFPNALLARYALLMSTWSVVVVAVAVAVVVVVVVVVVVALVVVVLVAVLGCGVTGLSCC